METFRVGDFIRLKNLSKYYLDITILSFVNVFEIEDIIKGVEYIIKDCNTKIPDLDIEPIPINGMDDKYISLKLSPMAKYVGYNDLAPNMRCNDSYFFDDFKNLLVGNQEAIRNFKFVHEVQHYLYDELKNSCLLNIDK